ncbi:MAG: SurA N-terminal domain-containing protein [Terriglobia bacterium]
MHKARGFTWRNRSNFTSIALVVLLSFSFFAPPAAGQGAAPTVTLNRVVASVGGIPLTQRDVQQEFQLETLLSTGKALAAPAAASVMGGVLSRLIDQKLLEQALTDYRFDPSSINREANDRMAGLRKKFNGEAAFQAALHTLGTTEGQLMDRLKEQGKILEMIDEQLRPSATVSAQEIESYYQKTLLPGYEGKGAPPALKEAQSEIREILVQKNINQLLDQWLAELKKDHPVEILAQ